jgi:hypothetical protein
METILKIHKKLQIPFDKNFYNLPMSHYQNLSESIGAANVNACVRELIVYYKDNAGLAEKARILKRKLNKEMLSESTIELDVCECGFKTMGEEYRECPICLKKMYTGACFYLNEDKSCSLDGEECSYSNEQDCKKI